MDKHEALAAKKGLKKAFGGAFLEVMRAASQNKAK